MSSSAEVYKRLLAAATPELRAWLQQHPQRVLAVLARVSNLLEQPVATFAAVQPSKASGNILAARLETFKARIATLARKAQKLGLPLPVVEYGTPFWEKIPQADWEIELGHAPRYRERIPVTVDMPAIQIPGWQFQATVEHRMAGQHAQGPRGFANLIKLAPGVASLPEAYRTAGPHCDHCKTRRWRNETFVLAKDGKRVRIGRQCLRDYIGAEDAETLIALSSFLDDMRGATGDGEEGGGFSDGYLSSFRLRDVLVRAAQDIREHGYMGRKQANEQGVESTADSVRFMLMPPKNLPPARRPPPPAAGDVEVGEAALAWVRTAPGNSDFMHNLRALATHEYVGEDDLGMAVAIIPAYQNAQRIAQEATAAGPGGYLGKVGERFGGAKKSDPPPLTATILRRTTTHSIYGTSTLFSLRTPAGFDLLLFLSGTPGPGFREGVVVRVSGTVKAHTLDKLTQRPVTQLTRADMERVEGG